MMTFAEKTTAVKPAALQWPGAVIFDMDGLLLDTEVIYRQVWCEAGARLGYSLAHGDYLPYAGRRAQDCAEDLEANYGPNFPLEVFNALQEELYEAHRQRCGLPIKTGVRELLDFLTRVRLRKAVATSSQRDKAFECLGELRPRFETIVTGDEVVRGKPAPDIFLLAARRFQLAPEQCLVLEDSEPGAQAAHAAGMSAILVPDLKPPSPRIVELATGVCSNLLDVKELLEEAYSNRRRAGSPCE